MAVVRQRTYQHQRERRREKRLALISKLGGECVDCGSADAEKIEFDHKDPSTKSFNISGNFNLSWARLVAEARKCELRCSSCHVRKHFGHKPGAHGTRSAVRYWRHGCRCKKCCAAAKAKSRREYMKRKAVQKETL